MRKKLLPLLGILAFLLLACSCPLTPLLTPTPAPTFTPSPTPLPTDGSIPPPAIDQDSAPFNYPWDDRLPFQSNLAASSQSTLDELPGATVYHLALSFGDPPSEVIGVEEVLYTNTENVPLTEVDFALFPNLLGGRIFIQNILVNGSEVEADIQNWLMRIPFAQPLQPGDSLLFHIEFQVQVPSGGGNFYYGIFGYNNGILSFAHAYPTILVYNQEGWNNQAPDLDGDPLFSDASFYIVLIDAPVDLTIVASGVELDRNETGERQQVLITDGPARDFYLAASLDLIKTSQVTDRGVTVNSYAPASEASGAQEALQFGVAAIEEFSQRYGDYPYTEFDIVPIITSAGGVEYPGMTAVSSDAYSWGNYLEVVVVHEAAHMWFYNLVGNDTLDQPWLDEALAQFATWQYYLDRYGETAAEEFKQNDLQGNWNMAADPNTPIGLPVSAYSDYNYASIVYGRGPFFFMALRDQMGVDVFDQFMRDYVKRYSWGISTSDGFKALAEQHCNCDLTPLFEEWVYP